MILSKWTHWKQPGKNFSYKAAPMKLKKNSHAMFAKKNSEAKRNFEYINEHMLEKNRSRANFAMKSLKAKGTLKFKNFNILEFRNLKLENL